MPRKKIESSALPLTEDELKEREKILTDLIYFCKNYLKYNDVNEQLHQVMADELKKISELKTMMFLIPRGHLKSSLITIAWVMQQMLGNVDLNIGLVNATFDKCVEFLAEIKYHLGNSKLVKLFPDLLYPDMGSASRQKEGIVWKVDAITLKGRSRGDGYNIKCHGFEQGITGKHYDIMVFDDLVDANNSDSIVGIRKVQRTFRNCRSVLNHKPLGWRIIVGTRWKREDLYGWLLSEDTYYYRREDIDEKTGQPIFPEKFSLEILTSIKKEQGTVFYALQYKNKVIAEGANLFRLEHIQYYKDEVKYKRIYFLIDLAISLEKKGDETVICKVCQSETGPLHVSFSKGGQWTATESIKKIFEEVRIALTQCDDIYVGIEIQAQQLIFKQWVQKVMNERGVYFNLVDLKPGNKTKQMRIDRLLPYFENNGLVFRVVGCEELISQILDYPLSVHDDHVDALAYLPDIYQSGSDAGVYEINKNYDDEEDEENVLSWRDM